MANYDQILKYHIKELQRNFPELHDNIKMTSPAFLTIGKSTCVFDYGDSEEIIERRFRSGNYDFVFVDQAELFSEEEIKELRKTIRSTKGHKAKLILSFNMRGSGMKWLRKWFNSPDMPNPKDYKAIRINPWDNVFWSLDALIKDGFTMKDYFRWPDLQRKEYAALNGQYTKQLALDDNDAIRAADWDGSWDSIEGSYFDNVFDLATVRISRDQVFKLSKDWSSHWISQDWGRSHYTVNYWFFKTTLGPSEVNKILGWNIKHNINVIVTYRESILNNLESNEIAQRIVENTPINERKKIKAFYLGQDAYKIVDSKNTIELKQSEVMRKNGMVGATRADWERVAGWTLMAQLLKATKGKGFIRNAGNDLSQVNDVWLISSECPQLLQSIPNLMRDKKNLEDVSKTDKTKTDIDMDTADACRYGLKSMLAAKKKTAEQAYNEVFQAASPQQQTLMTFRKFKEDQLNTAKVNRPSWKNRIKK